MPTRNTSSFHPGSGSHYFVSSKRLQRKNCLHLLLLLVLSLFDVSKSRRALSPSRLTTSSFVPTYQQPKQYTSVFTKNTNVPYGSTKSRYDYVKQKSKGVVALFQSSSNFDNNHDHDHHNAAADAQTRKSQIRRTSLKGVSVSPTGFLVLLSTPKPDDDIAKDIILPLRLTSSNVDEFAATSAESLTICQLLGGVDMAGAILSPDVLKNVVGLFCSNDDDNDDDNGVEEGGEENVVIIEDELGLESINVDDDHDEEAEISVREFVHKFLSTTLGKASSFEDANQWQKSRVTFPKISLDSVRVDLPSYTTYGDNHHWEKRSTNSGNSDYSEWIKGLKKEANLIRKLCSPPSNSASSTSQQQPQNLLFPIPLKYTLECRIDGDKTLDVPLYSELDLLMNLSSLSTKFDDEIKRSSSILQQVLYSYDPQSSAAFLSMALALRYKCPVVIGSTALDAINDLQKSLQEGIGMCVCIEGERGNTEMKSNDQELEAKEEEEKDDMDASIRLVLPQWRSLTALKSQSQRVVANIEQGFQVTKLQSALKIALEKGDELAAEKIRTEIDRLLNASSSAGTEEDDEGILE